MRLHKAKTVACAAGLVLYANAALQVDFNSIDSIKKASATIAKGMVSYYNGDKPGQVPGLLPQPYYWWETGAMFSALIDYWYYTGDTQYNRITEQAMLFQVGPNEDYMPPNRTKDLGNDDQSFWAMTAMNAAEHKFPDPPAGQPQWLALVQAVFNKQAPRWDTSTCGGGLRWQVFAFNRGYNYKNSISNGCFFNIAARLGRYTENQTYLEWAEKAWDWEQAIGLISSDYHIYDGSDDAINCTKLNHIEWSYNIGVHLYGAAIMWNVTQAPKWRTRIEGLMRTSQIFFANGVMKEVACEDNNTCNVDQRSFKAYLSRWLAASSKVAPFIADTVMTRLKSSATAAVRTCSGGPDGNQCGHKWTLASFDGPGGVGEQMSALEVTQSLLAPVVAGPVTAKTGGTSLGNAGAGSASGSEARVAAPDAVTAGDRAGAGILTALVLITMGGGSWWMAKETY